MWNAESDARDRLLVRLLDAFEGDLPSPEMSLREVAARTETSHALLRYHFGSLSGVLAAMLMVQRSRDNETLVKDAQQSTFDDFVVAIWRAYTRPEQLARARGFFHVVGLGRVQPDGLRRFRRLARRPDHDAGVAGGTRRTRHRGRVELGDRHRCRDSWPAPAGSSDSSGPPQDAIGLILRMARG